MGVVVRNESNMMLYFPEVGNSYGSNTNMCSDVAGPLSSGLGDLFELSDRSNETGPESHNRVTHYNWLPS